MRYLVTSKNADDVLIYHMEKLPERKGEEPPKAETLIAAILDRKSVKEVRKLDKEVTKSLPLPPRKAREVVSDLLKYAREQRKHLYH